MDAPCLHGLLQHGATPGVELFVQGPGTAMYYCYPHPPGIQTVGHLQTEQAGTNDDRVAPRRTDLGQGLDIAHVAIAVDPG